MTDRQAQRFQMRFTVHGVRGSVPNPSPAVLGYGGNTSCYEIETEQSQIFIDTGTGFRTAAVNKQHKPAFILFSHLHHDHIQGFPFNGGVYAPGADITLSSALFDAEYLHAALRGCFSGAYFPADIFGPGGKLAFRDFSSVCARLADDIDLSFIRLNHPGGAAGYSFVRQKKKIVTLFDNEYERAQEDRLREFCSGADLVIWDGMYTDAELQHKRGWGHSSIEEAVRFCERADVEKMLITHHEPNRTDQQLDDLKSGLGGARVDFAHEGLSLTL